MTIKTKRLEIELMTTEEVEKLLTGTTDEGLIKAYSEMLRGALDDEKNAAWYLPWAMVLAESKTYIGNIGFHGPARKNAAEIGYGIEPEFEGRGYTTEAAEAMIGWAFAQPGVEEIEAEAEETNAASLRILEKLGFQKCGIGEEGPRFVKKKS